MQPINLTNRRAMRDMARFICVCVFVSPNSAACRGGDGNIVFDGITTTNSSQKIHLMYKKTKTVCIGRFLIDVPKTAEVAYGPVHTDYPLIRYPGKGAEIEDQVAGKLTSIRNQKDLAYGELLSETSMLGKTIGGQAHGQSIVFGIGRSIGSFYEISSFLRVGDDLFVQEAQSSPKATRISEVIRSFNNVAVKIRPRRTDEIPTDAGICVDGAFVADPAEPVYEWVTLGVRFQEMPDVHFSISMTKKDVLVPSDALEPRIVRAEQEARKNGFERWLARVKVFRRGERTIGNWKGYEFLARKPAQEGSEEAHEFAFLSQGEPKIPLLPVLDIKMDSGVAGNVTGGQMPTIKDDEAVELWDRVISTLRVRPVM